jgi:Trk K+ transport system NAD-binding subunit
LEDYDFPGDSKIVLITRPDGSVESPRGNLVMQAEDTVLMISDVDEYASIWKSMVRR